MMAKLTQASITCNVISIDSGFTCIVWESSYPVKKIVFKHVGLMSLRSVRFYSILPHCFMSQFRKVLTGVRISTQVMSLIFILLRRCWGKF